MAARMPPNKEQLTMEPIIAAIVIAIGGMCYMALLMLLERIEVQSRLERRLKRYSKDIRNRYTDGSN